MTPNSSLDSSLPNPSQTRDRAPDGALTREQHSKLCQLQHRAATAGVTVPSKSELADLIAGGDAAERRISEAETRAVVARAEKLRGDRAEQPKEQVA